ncbi:MAG: cell division protein ZapA [Gammaproteobacteria bacterium]|nr:MAG: cell division protein ZapA [Gammaproteobacteria bacterium]
MSQKKAQPTSLSILDKEYVVSCSEEEAPGLRAAARYLDTKMREIRDTGRVVGLDRIAVMAALNISHDLTQSSGESESLSDELSTRLEAMQKKISLVLESNE